MAEFTGFYFNNIHSSTYHLYRTSDGNRYEEGLIPDFEDRSVSLVGTDGDLFGERRFKATPFTIKIAFDSVTEQDLRDIRNWLAVDELKPFQFDERPYKTYYVKVSSRPVLNYLCFNEEDEWGNTIHIYKGEGSITFTAYDPFGYCVDESKVLGEVDGAPAFIETGLRNRQELDFYTSLGYEHGDDFVRNFFIEKEFPSEESDSSNIQPSIPIGTTFTIDTTTGKIVRKTTSGVGVIGNLNHIGFSLGETWELSSVNGEELEEKPSWTVSQCSYGQYSAIGLGADTLGGWILDDTFLERITDDDTSEAIAQKNTSSAGWDLRAYDEGEQQIIPMTILFTKIANPPEPPVPPAPTTKTLSLLYNKTETDLSLDNTVLWAPTSGLLESDELSTYNTFTTETDLEGNIVLNAYTYNPGDKEAPFQLLTKIKVKTTPAHQQEIDAAGNKLGVLAWYDPAVNQLKYESKPIKNLTQQDIDNNYSQNSKNKELMERRLPEAWDKIIQCIERVTQQLEEYRDLQEEEDFFLDGLDVSLYIDNGAGTPIKSSLLIKFDDTIKNGSYLLIDTKKHLVSIWNGMNWEGRFDLISSLPNNKWPMIPQGANRIVFNGNEELDFTCQIKYPYIYY